MSVYKDNATGKWRVIYRYTDITGKRKQTQKRGFETKREAVAWEHEMMLKAQAKLDMTFGSFYLGHEMERGCKASGVKKIRIHDLRHSHVSLLINMGFSALAIGKRVGHETEKITYRYAHLFPTVQNEMAEKLEIERMTKEA